MTLTESATSLVKLLDNSKAAPGGCFKEAGQESAFYLATSSELY
jgi:hypothetical protein